MLLIFFNSSTPVYSLFTSVSCQTLIQKCWFCSVVWKNSHMDVPFVYLIANMFVVVSFFHCLIRALFFKKYFVQRNDYQCFVTSRFFIELHFQNSPIKWPKAYKTSVKKTWNSALKTLVVRECCLCCSPNPINDEEEVACRHYTSSRKIAPGSEILLSSSCCCNVVVGPAGIPYVSPSIPLTLLPLPLFHFKTKFLCSRCFINNCWHCTPLGRKFQYFFS